MVGGTAEGVSTSWRASLLDCWCCTWWWDWLLGFFYCCPKKKKKAIPRILPVCWPTEWMTRSFPVQLWPSFYFTNPVPELMWYGVCPLTSRIELVKKEDLTKSKWPKICIWTLCLCCRSINEPDVICRLSLLFLFLTSAYTLSVLSQIILVVLHFYSLLRLTTFLKQTSLVLYFQILAVPNVEKANFDCCFWPFSVMFIKHRGEIHM